MSREETLRRGKSSVFHVFFILQSDCHAKNQFLFLTPNFSPVMFPTFNCLSRELNTEITRDSLFLFWLFSFVLPMICFRAARFAVFGIEERKVINPFLVTSFLALLTLQLFL